MPYKIGERLPGEKASRLGHLEVLKSQLVNALIKDFEESSNDDASKGVGWQPMPSDGEILPIVFGIDGSFQIIESETPPYKRLAFIKTALLRIDQSALSKLDRYSPNPFALGDILKESALYHATVFPLKHVSVKGVSTYHAVREIIFESLKDNSLNGEPLETLKWICFEKWDGKEKRLPLFECPHCEKMVATLPYDIEEGTCPSCQGKIYISDFLGFHQEMAPDVASDGVATTYMNIHETLLLFTGIRYYWENNRKVLPKCLFVKDGPLSIRAQYSKLVAPIRRFLAHARKQGFIIHIIGQEKSGQFFEHLELIGRNAPEKSYFLPGDSYIKKEIQQRPQTGAPYGKDTNYGAKIFVKLNQYHKMVLNVPIGEFKENPTYSDLIGANDIFCTLPAILSNRYEGAILPIELANGVASLSTYPSAHILKLFSEEKSK